MSRLFGFLTMVAGGSAAYYGVQYLGLDNIGGIIVAGIGSFVAAIGLLWLAGTRKARRYAEKITGLDVKE